MGLIDVEQVDEATLRAEDEAIRQAERGEQPKAQLPIGDDLAQLIEDLTNGAG